VSYGIKHVAAHYNSLDVARKLLEVNGVATSNIHTQEVTGAPVFPGKKFDIVISLISWGFHYPVSTYLDQVYNLLATGGTLIIDVRKDQGGEDILKNKFDTFKVILEAQKYRRVIATKK
jgi:16S rRNA G1207 methylase RsmC